MSTLQVNDPRSRGRSKSPSGRIRERSRSRDSRVPSPAPEPTRKPAGGKKYYDSDSADENLRSRSRDPRTRNSAYRDTSRVRYDVADDYLSDSGDDVSQVRGSTRRPASKYYEKSGSDIDDKRYGRSHGRQPSKYDSYSDDSFSDSADEALAYGDVPGRRERGHYRLSSSPRRESPPKASGKYNGSDTSSMYRPSASSSRPEDVPEQQIPGSHPSYARPMNFRYAEPANFVHAQPASAVYGGQASYGGPPTTSASPSDWAAVPECERPGFVPPTSHAGGPTMPGAFPPISSFPEVSSAPAPVFPVPQYVNLPQQSLYAQPGHPLSIPTSSAYVPPPISSPTQTWNPSADVPQPSLHANLPQWQYAQIDPKITYTSKTASKQPYTQSPENQYVKSYTQSVEPQFAQPAEKQYTKSYTQSSEPQFVEITPGSRKSAGRPPSLSVSSANNLGVSGSDLGRPPASPLLEPYKGTYQSISPMPSPIMIPSKLDDDLSDLEPLDGRSDTERRKKSKKLSDDEKERKEKKADKFKKESLSRHERHGSHSRHERHDSHEPESVIVISPSSSRRKVSFYDASEHAMALQEALSHTRSIDTKPLITILPQLTSDEILTLRKEYKNYAKLHGKGINIAKHIRLKLGTGVFGKVCYATALGRWESEAYWANCYYQSGSSRRELLIESLMGRTNAEIREIKDCFRDSRYADSLEKCMKAELKADKFRTAVLLALEERRQSEREPLDVRLVQQDMQELRRALMSREGGETAMIYIIVLRSDSHLREVLRAYEKVYGQNFPRAMIAKSRNLVGETLAHILNGAINRPMRDALLLHQALRESRTGKERSELLISRLVRLHWEPRHLERVKHEFRKRYNERLEEAIAEEVLTSSGASEWGEFCIELARSSHLLAARP